MTRRVLLDNEYITVWYHPNEKIVHNQTHRYTHGERFREALLVGLEALAENGACKWLSDVRATGALPAEDEEWVVCEWFPKSVEAGWKYWAVVEPVKVVGRLNVSRRATRYGEAGITTRTFSDPEEAMGWLETAERE